jgi:hypothetical protein
MGLVMYDQRLYVFAFASIHQQCSSHSCFTNYHSGPFVDPKDKTPYAPGSSYPSITLVEPPETIIKASSYGTVSPLSIYMYD